MANSSRLLGLPAELRQKIIEKTFTIVCKVGTRRLVLECPMRGICQLLQADYNFVIQSWLPDPRDTTVFAALTNPDCIGDLANWNARFQRVAAASNRTWAGVEEVTLMVFSNRVPLWKPIRNNQRIVYKDYDMRNRFEYFVYTHWGIHLLPIPSSVRHLKLDMTVSQDTIDRKLEQWDEKWGADAQLIHPIYPINLAHPFVGTKAHKRYCFQQMFWVTLFNSVELSARQILQGRAPGLLTRDIEQSDGRVSIPGLTIEIVGELPASQVEALVLITGVALLWRNTWSKIFANYTKGVIERIEANTKDEG
ncbi:uncharacterized protein BDZ99DRAFT_481295 [Mytilinidion resinicola]|uniref:Uncharacterized protein n=1 Tax=Mytilinidion resinicola TaxID=574789 RepID=A0A6A6Y6Q8_9PEZI|nr:uncharacterized protein BDZ99DRAFT_481295 [Mytilinidion resinicola]KAF2804492.1 hypothetical protein BDZ99DRAFT_481295 [Mytilinidion resinicola]